MKTWSTRTLRNVFFGIVLTVLPAMLGGIAWYAAERYRMIDKQLAPEYALLAELGHLKQLRGRAEYATGVFASEPDSEPFAQEALHRILAFRRAASALEHMSGRYSEAFRQGCAELSAAARRTHAAALSGLSEQKYAAQPGMREELRESLSDMRESLSESSDLLPVLDALALERLRTTSDSFRKVFFHLAALLGGVILCGTGLSFLGFHLIGRNIARALHSLSDGTRELRTGNMEYRFRNITPDETGQLKYDFNIMARKLQFQEHELRTRAEQLMEAHQHKDRFLSNMSHELRTPLNSIIGFSELIEARAERLTPEKLKSQAHRILTAAEHLLALITSLLDLAKSGAGTLKPVFTEYDLAQSLSELIPVLAPLAEKKGLALKSAIPDALPVFADQRMIRQIFINLFSNAVKYTPSGTVGITLKAAPDGGILLSVSDTGIGIPASEHKNIFKDFYRVDNGPSFLADGVGIGLVLSRRLAALHKGTLTFESEAGKGSVFTLHLPAENSQPQKD